MEENENTLINNDSNTGYTFRAEEEFKAERFAKKEETDGEERPVTHAERSEADCAGPKSCGTAEEELAAGEDHTYSFRQSEIRQDYEYGRQPVYGNMQYNCSGNQRGYDYYSPEYYSAREYAPAGENAHGKGKVSSFFKKLGTAAACAVLFGAVAAGAFYGTRTLYYKLVPGAVSSTDNAGAQGVGGSLLLDPVTDESIRIETTTLSSDISPVNTDVSTVVEATMPSVVTITGRFAVNSWFGVYESEGGGSGIIVGENDNELLIATNSHVVADSLSLSVTLCDNTSYTASIKGTDPVADLAVIAINRSDIPRETYNGIRIAKLGNSDEVKVGQMAIAIGNALGYGQSTTVGYISAKEREVDVDGQKMLLLQTDAAINPGNSGGALLNISGEVIGINSVKYASSEVEGMGFAIPISRASAILDDLMSREILTDDERGYLGVYIETITSDMAAYNWPIGVYVTQTIEGGAAEKAGIYAGDIITAVNNTTVTTSEALQEVIAGYRAGTAVDVTVQRLVDGEFKEMTIKVTLGNRTE